MQIAEAAYQHGAGERLPDSFVTSELGAIVRQSELRVGAQVRGDLLRFGFINTHLVCQQCRVVLLKALADLVPIQGHVRRGWRLRLRPAHGAAEYQRKVEKELVSHR